MSAVLDAFHASLVDLVGDAWPELVSRDSVGIYRSREIVRTAFELIAGENELPVAVIDYAWRPSDQWGLANVVQEGTVYVYYVVGEDVLPGALDAKLETLRDALLTVDLVNGQITGTPCVTQDMALPPNQFFTNAQQQYWAGAVVFPALVGYSP